MLAGVSFASWPSQKVKDTDLGSGADLPGRPRPEAQVLQKLPQSFVPGSGCSGLANSVGTLARVLIAEDFKFKFSAEALSPPHS